MSVPLAACHSYGTVYKPSVYKPPAGTITEFSNGITGGAGTNLRGITAGPDGNLWFAEDSGNRIGQITPQGRYEVALIENTQGTIEIEAGDNGFDALLIAGIPLGEPVSRYGPFVMNTHEEIAEAIADSQAERFG